jgi:holo-[acyl-carrier protein] synthase
VIGVGTDVVDIARFRRALGRSPGMVERVFTEAERSYSGRHRDPAQRLAARFAAKEATMKVLGVGLGAFRFHDVEVVRAESGAPALRLTGAAAELAGRRGVERWSVSMTHSDLVALAVVIGE